MESMNKVAFQAKLKEVLLETIQERVRDGYERSQQAVPVITGNLKRSGKETDIDNGAKIEYKMEYASIVERGAPAHYEQLGGFFRKNGAFVKAHTRHMPEKKPKNYIKNSLKTAFERFSITFDSNLRAKFKRVTWK